MFLFWKNLILHSTYTHTFLLWIQRALAGNAKYANQTSYHMTSRCVVENMLENTRHLGPLTKWHTRLLYERYCNLAFIITGTCFTVYCHTEEGCKVISSPGARFKPMISNVVRGRRYQDSRDREKLGHEHHGKSDIRLPSVPSNVWSLWGSVIDVTFRNGKYAGKCKAFGSANDMAYAFAVWKGTVILLSWLIVRASQFAVWRRKAVGRWCHQEPGLNP